MAGKTGKVEEIGNGDICVVFLTSYNGFFTFFYIHRNDG